MRNLFAELLHEEMGRNDSIYLLTADLGFGVWDDVLKDYPKRAFNVGASEQAMLDIAVGLAYEGKTPICYSIPTFLIYRPFETLRTYIDHECLPVKMVGSGRDKDYSHDGWSHDASDVGPFLELLENVDEYWPQNKIELREMTADMLTSGEPAYISLKR